MKHGIAIEFMSRHIAMMQKQATERESQGEDDSTRTDNAGIAAQLREDIARLECSIGALQEDEQPASRCSWSYFGFPDGATNDLVLAYCDFEDSGVRRGDSRRSGHPIWTLRLHNDHVGR